MKYNKIVGGVSIHIDTKRIDDNLRRAQDALDQQVLNDMIPYMPESQQSAMVGATQIIEPGLISTNTPYGEKYGMVQRLRSTRRWGKLLSTLTMTRLRSKSYLL